MDPLPLPFCAGELLLTSTPEGAVQSGVQAFTKASVEACNTCCGEFFKEQLYREECQEGCGVFGEKVRLPVCLSV